MASLSIFRLAARSSASTLCRPCTRTIRRAPLVAQSISAKSPFSSTAVHRSSGHEEETFEEFSARYEKEFDSVQDVFELQRNLNNAFAYDLVPSPGVVTAALKAARRVNDYPTAVRIFEGIKAKVENTQQYEEYLEELKPLREELGVNLKEDLYPGDSDSPHHNP
ncbi:Cytochrome c oxidase subunit 6 [Exophiala xenobiotica]|uniref:Cytochrome c oxidase subunit 6, mitochondrial n=1 Tax=Vermiconidia calcicola TaxID=1690605 RepID=A0AAV9PSK0_9PEZI|nr:Cytochrome c oxidase subunit 6 [Exophiala xenobiotica]KAK5528035.1 Cytochrome c oxidase subunit 6 [Vermiconidia calcicola]KAK5532093.1 Cytochrome c oxidase subunit 6 [Chaetothyriales sp. CCFEE 6169]KAK5196823.1 Cytochrome c oxidase subunit 6 [Exophiala xenobiotica]KAK5207282.1 Cytochrome c oxidase subunit 6 [Exophiala xenobiotica]